MSIETRPSDEPLPRTLHWWSEVSLGIVSTKVRAALASWCMDWGTELGGLRAINAADAATEASCPCLAGSLSGGLEWQTAGGDANRSFEAMLFGTSARGSASANLISAEVSRRALADLRSALSVLCLQSSPSTSTVSPAMAAWSGQVIVNFELWREKRAFRLRLCLSVDQVIALCPRTSTKPLEQESPVVPLVDALREQVLTLKAHLNPTELTIGQLRSMRPNDLLVIPHHLDRPLSVCVHASAGVAAPPQPCAGHTFPAPWCLAHLGARLGRRAIELMAPDP